MAALAVSVTGVLKRAIALIGGPAGKRKYPRIPLGRTAMMLSGLRKEATNMRLEKEWRMM